MRITILPKTKYGKQSVIMMIIIWVLFVVGSWLPYKSVFSSFEFIINNPLQTTITILIFFLGIVAFFMGLKSVLKRKERSILVFLAVLVGLYFVLSFFGAIANLFNI